jgi:CBS domain-containing protein
MSTTVDAIMAREPAMVAPDTSIPDAARALLDRRAAALLVVDRDRCVGIVTDHDLLALIADNDLSRFGATARDLMVSNPHVLHPGDSYETACRLIAESGYRALPVLDERRGPVGLVSAKELLVAQSLRIEQLETKAFHE